MALEMRERCQRCAWPLEPDDDSAYICSYECTYCATCANELNGVCTECGGELMRRPRRVRKPPGSASSSAA